METDPTYTAFAAHQRVTSGTLGKVLPEAKALLDSGKYETLLFFEDSTGKQVDFDFRGTSEEVVARAVPAASHGPGRPRLGVVSREISLLPRHWEWLEQQPSGISAAIRRLVEEARKHEPETEKARLAIEATSRVMTALAGDRRGYEEATRALFQRDRPRFDALIDRWPVAIKTYLRWLIRDALPKQLMESSDAGQRVARKKTKKK
jgi:hypothetical protein